VISLIQTTISSVADTDFVGNALMLWLKLKKEPNATTADMNVIIDQFTNPKDKIQQGKKFKELFSLSKEIIMLSNILKCFPISFKNAGSLRTADFANRLTKNLYNHINP
jgi:hypothetical protein